MAEPWGCDVRMGSRPGRQRPTVVATPPHSFPASTRQSPRLLLYPPYPTIIAVIEQEVDPTAARATRNGQAVSKPEEGVSLCGAVRGAG